MIYGEVMKHYISMTIAIIILNMGVLVGAEVKITPTTVGDNSIVNAIKQHSNITQAYVNRWKPFGLWIVGPSLRSGVFDAIINYIRVCKSLDLARVAFETEESLMKSFPINWTVGALCAALKNLKDQGMYALALLAQIDDGSGMYKKSSYKELSDTITSYITIIEHNKNLIKDTCDALVKMREEKRIGAVKLALDRVTISEKRAKSWSDKFNVVKGIKEVFTPQPTMPTALIGMALYVAQKVGLFDESNIIEGN